MAGPWEWLIPTVVGAGTNIFSNIKQAQAQTANVEKTNQANMELARYQFMKNKEMWELMKAYNTPSEQMKRFKEAGLNPNLMYGMGTPGNVGGHPEYQAPNLDYTGRPSVAGAAMSGGLQGAYQGIQEYQRIAQQREAIKQAEIKTWLDQETSLSKRHIAAEQSFQAMEDTERKKVMLAKEELEKRILEIKKKFWEQGISPSDATYIRVGLQVLDQLGIDTSSILKTIPKAMKKQINN